MSSSLELNGAQNTLLKVIEGVMGDNSGVQKDTLSPDFVEDRNVGDRIVDFRGSFRLVQGSSWTTKIQHKGEVLDYGIRSFREALKRLLEYMQDRKDYFKNTISGQVLLDRITEFLGHDISLIYYRGMPDSKKLGNLLEQLKAVIFITEDGHHYYTDGRLAFPDPENSSQLKTIFNSDGDLESALEFIRKRQGVSVDSNEDSCEFNFKNVAADEPPSDSQPEDQDFADLKFPITKGPYTIDKESPQNPKTPKPQNPKTP